MLAVSKTEFGMTYFISLPTADHFCCYCYCLFFVVILHIWHNSNNNI